MILITSFGEFLFYFIVIFLFYFHFIKKKKKRVVAGICFLFGVVLGCPVLAAEEHVPVD